MEELRSEPAGRQLFDSLFDDLRKKLPREFFERGDMFNSQFNPLLNPQNEVWFREILGQIRPLLVDRLLRHQHQDNPTGKDQRP